MDATSHDPSSDFVIARLRRQLDELDDRMLVLLRRRVALARQIGRVKRGAGRPLRDANRETQLLSRIGDTAGDSLTPGAAQAIFRCIIEASLATEVADAE